ncbi:MAG TPA: SRPBCC family protein [Acidimicrobiales bacterium]
MELTNEFEVNAPVERAWAILTDVERIAPCMPGAQLQEIEGDEYRGIVKVKVGPITAQYKGAARFVEKDDAAKRAVLRAEGRDTRGQGNANATITATLVGDGESTKVSIVTDLTVTGKVAQFGRGVLADVSVKLLGQFVECLENDLLAPSSSGGADAPATSAEGEPAWSAAPAAPAAAEDVVEDTARAAEPAATTTVTATEPPSNGHAASRTAEREATTTAAATSGGSTVRKIESKVAEPVDLLDAAGVPVAKRAIPIVAGVLVILWFLRRRRRKRSR